MLKLPQQEYIKYLYENEDLSINQISENLNIDWRTAKKYAIKDNWNQVISPKVDPICKVMTDHFKDIIESILQEDLMVPRKQRHTSKRIYDRLIAEHSFNGSYRTVCAHVKHFKDTMRDEKKIITETFERLEHTGGEAQIDFCTLQVHKDQVLQDYKLLVMSFPYSNKAFVQPMPSENQECFLEGLKMLFEKCKGVPKRLWFDNLSAAVISSKPSDHHAHRTLTDGFIRFRSHYGFDAVFCNARKGNEKGNVENKCGYSRRNWCVPIPCFKDFESFSADLDRQAIEDAKRNHYYKEDTIESLFEKERSKLLKLPVTPYEVFKLSGATLNKYSEIAVDGTLFKVFNAAPNQTVLVKAYWDHVDILNDSHQLLGKVNRNYTFKPQEVNWLEVFRNYAVKPRTYKYSQFKKMLPDTIQHYLNQDESLQKERIKTIYHWLGKYAIGDIEKVLACSTGRETTFVLSKHLNMLNGQIEDQQILEDPYTPEGLQGKSQDLSVYDALTVKGGSKVCS